MIFGFHCSVTSISLRDLNHLLGEQMLWKSLQTLHSQCNLMPAWHAKPKAKCIIPTHHHHHFRSHSQYFLFRIIIIWIFSMFAANRAKFRDGKWEREEKNKFFLVRLRWLVSPFVPLFRNVLMHCKIYEFSSSLPWLRRQTLLFQFNNHFRSTFRNGMFGCPCIWLWPVCRSFDVARIGREL